jgi:hypothetical protein
MRDWLKSMLREWPLTAYTALSFVSTIATYYRPLVPGHIRVLLILSTMIGFGAATIRVDLKRQRRIAELEQKVLEQPKERKRLAELVIHPGPRSKYIAVRARDQYPLPPKALHLEFHLSVENKGERPSSINRYALTLPDFGKSYSDITPYFTNMVQGRNSNYALNPQQFFPTDFIRVPAESVAGPALLSFLVLDLPFDSFGTRAFDGDRETRIFPPVRCELKLIDTEGYSASCEFVLNELK